MHMEIEVWKIVFLALAVSAFSLTVTRAKVTGSFRDRMAKKNKFFGDLVSCPYCFSHWVAAVGVILWQPRTTEIALWPWLLWPLDYVLSAFVIIGIAALISGTTLALFGKEVASEKRVELSDPGGGAQATGKKNEW